MSAKVYPYLQQLFGAYMHQDWPYEGEDWPDLVRNFVRDESAVDLEAVAAEIDGLLAEYPDEARLHQQVYGVLGCSYDPRSDLGGPTVRNWLRMVAALLRQVAPKG